MGILIQWWIISSTWCKRDSNSVSHDARRFKLWRLQDQCDCVSSGHQIACAFSSVSDVIFLGILDQFAGTTLSATLPRFLPVSSTSIISLSGSAFQLFAISTASLSRHDVSSSPFSEACCQGLWSFSLVCTNPSVCYSIHLSVSQSMYQSLDPVVIHSICLSITSFLGQLFNPSVNHLICLSIWSEYLSVSQSIQYGWSFHQISHLYQLLDPSVN